MMEVLDMAVSLLVRLVCLGIAAVFARVIIPWAKDELIPWLKDKRLYEIVQSFVLAAEKLAESGAIDKELKKKFVIDCLTEKGIVVTDEIDAMIESAVEELDIAIKSGLIMIGDVFSRDNLIGKASEPGKDNMLESKEAAE